MESVITLLQNIPLLNNVLLLFFIFTFAIVFWRASKNPSSPVDWADIIVDAKTGKASNTKLGHFWGVVLSSWVIMYFAQKVEASQIAAMFPWVFGTWLTFLVTSTGIKQFIGSKDKTEIITKDDPK